MMKKCGSFFLRFFIAVLVLFMATRILSLVHIHFAVKVICIAVIGGVLSFIFFRQKSDGGKGQGDSSEG
ncbi:MAG: hypothetical protein ACI3W5_01660 [Faecousia sp.]